MSHASVRPGAGRPLRALVYLVLWVGAGCVPAAAAGGVGDGARQTDSEGITAALSADTAAALFVLGRDESFQPAGGLGTITPGPPPAATMIFREVPEGRHSIDFAGYASRSFAAPNPPEFPATAYCLRDFGDTRIAVVSDGRPERATIAATATTVECALTGVDRYIVDSDYEGDPNDPWFGAQDGDNVSTLYLDGWGAAAGITIDVDTGAGSPPLGLFETLPDVAGGETWPDPEGWNSVALNLTADANGDAFCHLVAKPGARPVLWEISATGVTPADSAQVLIWVSRRQAGPQCSTAADCDDGIDCTVDTCNANTATCEWVPDDSACNDGNPCTSETCDPASGCANPPLPHGTPCAAGAACENGVCVPVGERFGTLDLLTGDASNTGGALGNFPDMRCGNSNLIGPFEVEFFPALTFDLSPLVQGETIESVTMHVFQERVDGDNPYTGDMLEVVAEHVRFDVLFDADIAPPVTGTIGQRPVSSSGEPGWRTADITEAVLFEVAAGRDRVQVRLRFVPSMTDGDGEPDLAIFASDNANEAAHHPYLTVRYGP
jgi:hypothetical protein